MEIDEKESNYSRKLSTDYERLQGELERYSYNNERLAAKSIEQQKTIQSLQQKIETMEYKAGEQVDRLVGLEGNEIELGKVRNITRQQKQSIHRLNEEIKKSNKKQPTHAAHQNTPDARSMMGRYRSQVPAKLRRFT